VFGEIDGVRISMPQAITHDFEFTGGVGADIALTHYWALQIIPGEYILATPSQGPHHNCGAQAGFSFSFGGK
jgi:hypothetical protein